jgi:tetratricopeptide (TPR) repeat protein
VWWLISLLFAGCSLKTLNKESINLDKEIVKALVLENDNQSEKAILIYEKLYNKTNKRVFLRKIVENLFFLKKYKDVLSLSSGCFYNFDKNICKYRILSLIKLSKIEDAKKELLRISHRDSFFYKIMVYIEFKKNNIKEMSRYLKSWYAIEKDERILLRLVDVLREINSYNEAVAYLRTYIQENGCNIKVCKRLALIYQEVYDFYSLAKLYEMMGEIDSSYLKKAFNIYIENGEYKKALKIANELGGVYLLRVYRVTKEYKKGAKLALKLYNKTKNLSFLVEWGFFNYFANKNEKSAKEVVEKLLPFVDKIKNDAVYNFVGYLMIEYDIDIKKGLEFVRKALLIKDNEEYKDSLAWGYYKLKECKKAYNIIKHIILDNDEVKIHKKKIRECKEQR